SPRLEFNAGWFFATGNPFPLPVAQSYLSGHEEVRSFFDGPRPSAYFQFSRFDEFRSPLYHRLDASLKIQAKEKERRWNWDFYWEVGAFNVYNRLNPSFYLLEEEVNEALGQQRLRLQENTLFIFTPSLSLNWKF
ncbi:MAG: hypothetical protein AAF804_05210, partial [Bacteroidota bacterium]